MPRQSKPVVIGIGNSYRSDDGAGLVAARLLRPQLPSCSVFEHDGEGTSLMELWTGEDCVFVIDATRGAAAPGSITRFDATLDVTSNLILDLTSTITRNVTGCALPAAMFRGSTHAFSLPEAIELSRTLSRLPHQLIIYGVEGQDFQPGTNMSPAVKVAVNSVVQEVIEEVSDNLAGLVASPTRAPSR
ncbi:MAG TPA: hydrogenase maturation protease [Terriglobales bacterium]|jgi:hydrogenase maturation protease|nr:hydrogenase maturation protease [Terriglobales bacterium]